MHPWQHDPSLPVPAAHFAAASGALPFDTAPLRRTLDSTHGISLAGRYVEADFAADGTCAVSIDGIDTLRGLHVIDTDSAAAVMTSIGLERRVTFGDTELTERFMVLPDVAAFVAEWSAASPQHVTIQWTHAASGATRWNCNDSTILLSSTAYSICVAFANTAVEWSVEELTVDGASHLRVRARICASPNGALLYATSSSLPSGIPAIFRSIDDAAGRARAFIGTQRRRAMQAIALESPEPRLDDALTWAVQAIAIPRPIADRNARHAPHPVLYALAACASGSPAIAREVIAALDQHDPVLPLLVARYHAWTADSAFVATQWARTQAAVAHLIDARAPTSAAIALTAAALAEIAATAGDIGRAVLTTDVLTCLKQYRSDHAAALRTAHWIDAVDDPEADALRPARNDVSGFGTRSPAALIADVAYGMFGIEPEAARNRVRFRPHLPSEWDAALLRGIQIGDAGVRLGYSKAFDGDRAIHRFEASQDSGPTPVRLILEPLIVATRVHATTVDGTPAQLDLQAAGTRLMIPVQLVLDDTRVLEIVTDRAVPTS